MNKRIPLASTTFGVGNEHLALSPAEGDGILIVGNYSQEIPTAANKSFLAAFGKRFGDTKIVHEIAASMYQGIKLWAECVKKAGSLNRSAMLKAIESGPQIEAPSGTVVLEAKTHHCALDIYVMEVRGQKLTIKDTYKQRPPSDTAQYCDLIKNPKENRQFEVKI
jgi:branched-chain amino acid transport system substrate-binding protein